MSDLKEFAKTLRKQFGNYTITKDAVTGVRILDMLTSFDEAYDPSMLFIVDGKMLFPTTEEVDFIKSDKAGFAKLRWSKRLDASNVLGNMNSQFDSIVQEVRNKLAATAATSVK